MIHFNLQGKLVEQTKGVLETKAAAGAAIADATGLIFWTHYLNTGTKILGGIYLVIMIMIGIETWRAKRHKRLNNK